MPAASPDHPVEPSATAVRPAPTASELLGLSALIADTSLSPVTPAVVAKLRQRVGRESAAWVTEIAEQQSRAIDKWGAGVWMVTARALQQASDRVVARYKASLLGSAAVFDLCGGVGGDALELARRGPVLTIDRSPLMTAMAAANLTLDADIAARDSAAGDRSRRMAWSTAVAVNADVTDYPLPPDVALHVDPDRRPPAKSVTRHESGQRGSPRVVRPSDYLPSLEQVSRLLDRSAAAIVKLAPAAKLDEDELGQRLCRQRHRQWISLDGSVREQALLGGDTLAIAGVPVGGRSAIRLLRSAAAQSFAIDAGDVARLDEIDASLPVLDSPPGVVCDVDPAVRAAGLTAALASARGLAALGGPAGFLGSDSRPKNIDLLQCFEVVWFGPCDFKRVRRAIDERSLELTSVKVRGVDQDPGKWLKRLRSVKRRPRPAGPDRGAPKIAAVVAAEVSLLIGRTTNGVYAAIAKPHR